MIRFWIKNLLAVGLLVGSTSAFSEPELFVIECKVSGWYWTGATEAKITNQEIVVTVISKPPAASIRVDGSGHLNIGVVLGNDALVSNDSIHVVEDTKSNLRGTRTTISINRITGFIDISEIISRRGTDSLDMTAASGFCSKVSNKPKF